MCSYQEWESGRRRFQAIDEEELRELVADVAARVEAFVEELTGRACQGEDTKWVRGCGRRSRTRSRTDWGRLGRLPVNRPLTAWCRPQRSTSPRASLN